MSDFHRPDIHLLAPSARHREALGEPSQSHERRATVHGFTAFLGPLVLCARPVPCLPPDHNLFDAFPIVCPCVSTAVCARVSAHVCVRVYVCVFSLARVPVLQPFVDTSHPLQDFFLPRKYAIAIPTVLVIIVVTLVATFIALTLMKSARKKKQKAS